LLPTLSPKNIFTILENSQLYFYCRSLPLKQLTLQEAKTKARIFFFSNTALSHVNQFHTLFFVKCRTLGTERHRAQYRVTAVLVRQGCVSDKDKKACVYVYICVVMVNWMGNGGVGGTERCVVFILGSERLSR
jgi:hypothetical protein